MVPRKDHIDPRAAANDAEDPERVSDLEAQLGIERDLEGELDEALAAAARNLEAAKRWQAEFENFRRRQATQAEEQALRASERVVERLLPAIDDLERAIEHTTAGGDLPHLLAGVEMVHKKIIESLAKEGVEVLDPFGKPFDPHVHQAVSQREDPEFPEHTVVDVVQKGYRLHGKVLRPAAVVVSSGGPPQPAKPDESPEA